jgi:hypothetical protein
MEFVRGVMERLGVETASGLADAMGWPRGKERTVARWLAGETNPSYDNVIEMVERAGLLNTSEAGRSAALPTPLLPLEQLAANDAQLLSNQTQTMKALKEIVELLRTERGERHSAPKRKRTK